MIVAFSYSKSISNTAERNTSPNSRIAIIFSLEKDINLSRPNGGALALFFSYARGAELVTLKDRFTFSRYSTT